MTPRNLQTVIAFRDQDLIIDLGKQFLGVLTASMARDTEIVQNRKEFEIIDNRYLKLLREQAQDEGEGDEMVSILGRWYFDVRQETETQNHIVYTGTIFFRGNITK